MNLIILLNEYSNPWERDWMDRQRESREEQPRIQPVIDRPSEPYQKPDKQPGRGIVIIDPDDNEFAVDYSI
ncbi:MAG: hypothetical protein U9Q69_02850 [Nanoarchaeota archaeon]|nr:hypothetical protein [Nanoarchaeota archaeon]